MGTRSEKHFDITYVIKKFNANSELTFENIAREFGMSVEELEERLETMAGDDEKDRVRRAKTINKKRMRNRRKCREESTVEKTVEVVEIDEENTTMHEATSMPTPAISAIRDRKEQLEAQLVEVEAKLKAAKETFEALQSETEARSSILTEIKGEIVKKQISIKKAETQLKNGKAALEDLLTRLEAETQRALLEGEQLEEAETRIDEYQEIRDMFLDELESLDNFVVNLIDPNYDLSHGTPGIGRLISTVDFDGSVETEISESDIDTIPLSQVLAIIRKTGFKDIFEMVAAYEFAWLVVKYMTDQNYEVHVITDDPRISKMIDILMK